MVNTHTQLRDESFHEYVCQLFMLYNSPMGVQMLPLEQGGGEVSYYLHNIL